MSSTPSKSWIDSVGTWFTHPSWRWRLPVALVLYAVAAVGMALLAERHNGWLLAVAIVVLGAGVVACHHFINHPEPPPTSLHAATAEAMIIVGGAGLAVWSRIGRPDGVGFVALATVFLGVGELMGALRQRRQGVNLRLVVGAGLAGVCLLALLVGVLALGNGSLWPVFCLVGAVVVFPVPLELVSEEVLDRHWLDSVTWWRVVAGASVGAFVIGLGWLALTGPNWWLLFGGGAVLALLVGAIVSDTNADLVAVAVLVLVAVGTTPVSKPLPVALRPVAHGHVVVALGDSYSSGEGAKTYFVNTNTPGVNTCRRAPSAYGANLDVSRFYAGDKTIFLACSGAVADQLWQTAQAPQDPVDWNPSLTPDHPDLEPGLPQLGRYQFHNEPAPGPNLHLTPDLVMVGIGGNDAGFGDIVQACLLPGDCSKLGSRWVDHLTQNTKQSPSVRTSLETAFAKLKSAFGSTPIVVVPYPVPISTKACAASPFTANEAKFLNGFTNDLDAVVQQAAAHAGLHFLAAMQTAFSDNKMQICQTPHSKAWGVNLIKADSVDGNLEQTTNLVNWTHDSMHPNQPVGQPQMSKVVNRWLADPNRLSDSTPSASVQVKTVAQIMGTNTGDTCTDVSDKGCVGAWEQSEVHDLLLRDLVPVGLLVLSFWGVWLLFIRKWRALAPPGRGHRLRTARSR